MEKIVEKFELYGKEYRFETGELAKQTTGAVLVGQGDTTVLVTAVISSQEKDYDFFPLTVDYIEKMYAVGRIPGGYLKREARPSEKGTLTARMIDRPIRPGFAEGFKREVHVVATTLVADQENPIDNICVMGASAALMIGDAPFDGPCACVRVGRDKTTGDFICNPTYAEQENSDLDLIIAGTTDYISMIEAGAQEISEEDMLAAMSFGQTAIAKFCEAQQRFLDRCDIEKRDWPIHEADPSIAERIEPIEGKRYMHQYNFPPYCTGEVGRMGAPKRREIGHGALAERALIPVLPDEDEFPYAIRVVSEVLESNGSSSMASTCGSTLALMDAGVPIKAPVSGIAMGLIKEGDDVVILSDIQGVEDFLGDMDFKVTGTTKGITALQMDNKARGLSVEILARALEQAKRGRAHILDAMLEQIAAPREELSEYAPRIETIHIPVDKIRDVIGSGGKVVRGIQEETGAQIDIQEDGTIHIAAIQGIAGEAAKKMILGIVKEPEAGEEYEGEVVGIKDFGAFVKLTPAKDGLLHISRVANGRVGKVEDVLDLGDIIKVKVLEVDPKTGKISLDRLDKPEAPAGSAPARRERDDDKSSRKPRERKPRRSHEA